MGVARLAPHKHTTRWPSSCSTCCLTSAAASPPSSTSCEMTVARACRPCLTVSWALRPRQACWPVVLFPGLLHRRASPSQLLQRAQPSSRPSSVQGWKFRGRRHGRASAHRGLPTLRRAPRLRRPWPCLPLQRSHRSSSVRTGTARATCVPQLLSGTLAAPSTAAAHRLAPTSVGPTSHLVRSAASVLPAATTATGLVTARSVSARDAARAHTGCGRHSTASHHIPPSDPCMVTVE